LKTSYKEKKMFKKIKHVVETIALNAEGAVFGLRYARKNAHAFIIMDAKEQQLRALLAWADHLKATGRERFIYQPHVIETIREEVKRKDKYRSQFN